MPTLDRKQSIQAAMALDQYYTQPVVAQSCWDLLLAFLSAHQATADQFTWIEPSAGRGAFLDSAPKGVTIKGFDLEPPAGRPDVLLADFLSQDLPLPPNHLPIAVVGNPPFGKKAILARSFIARAQNTLDPSLIAFVLPVQFRKWSAQSKIHADWRLAADHDLPEEAFELCGKPYRVRCCFQIWAAPTWALSPGWPNLRLTVRPPVDHPDYEAYQFNRTTEAEKFFDYAWDFAVPRQGYVDYSTRAYRKDDCDRKQQWIFFKAHSKRALRILLSLDFDVLSKKNIGTPGFGKADVVEAYLQAVSKEPPDHVD